MVFHLRRHSQPRRKLCTCGRTGARCHGAGGGDPGLVTPAPSAGWACGEGSRPATAACEVLGKLTGPSEPVSPSEGGAHEGAPDPRAVGGGGGSICRELLPEVEVPGPRPALCLLTSPRDCCRSPL